MNTTMLGARDILDPEVNKELERQMAGISLKIQRSRKSARISKSLLTTRGFMPKGTRKDRRLRMKKFRNRNRPKYFDPLTVYSPKCPSRYEDYIKSNWWIKRKNEYYRLYGRKCEICGSCKNIHLHHKKYGNYGREKDEHLVALCSYHHGKFHRLYGRGTNNFIKKTERYIKEEKEMNISQIQIRISEINRWLAENPGHPDSINLKLEKESLNEKLKALIQARQQGVQLPEDPMAGLVCDSCQ